MSGGNNGQPGPSEKHRFDVGQRVAWSAGPHRNEGEGVVAKLLPATPQDGQPRYRIRVFVDGQQTEQEVELVDGVVFEVPRWAPQMSREERLRFHQGSTPPWNEEIESG
jgi:hypothetical protein